MTDHFPEAFKEFNKGRKKFKSFDEAFSSFKKWGGDKAPMTDKQVKALAIEVNYNKRGRLKSEKNRIATNVKIEKNGKIIYRDALTGMKMKDEYDKSRIPQWRSKDVIINKGAIENVNTGEILRLRRKNGTFLKRSKWTYIDNKGKTVKLYPSKKRSKRIKRR